MAHLKKNKFWVRISASISNLNLVCLAENLTFFLRHKLTGFNRQGFSQFSMRIWLSKKCFQMCSCVSLLCSSKSTRQSLTVEVRRQIMFNNSGKVGFNCNFESYQLCMMSPMWTDLAKFHHFGKIYEGLFSIWQKIKLPRQSFTMFGLNFVLLNGQILSNNRAIWSHW